MNTRSDNIYLRHQNYKKLISGDTLDIDVSLEKLDDILTETTKFFIFLVQSLGIGIKLLDKNNEELFIDYTLKL